MFKNIFWRGIILPGKEPLMPYPPDHKERTRAKIVEGARVLFNRHGFERVSIDAVMSSVGLTRGGFYRHFTSKDELYAAAVASFTSCSPLRKRLARTPRTRTATEIARMLVDTYLADATLADVDRHCPLIALPSDVARAGLEPRASYTALVESMTEVFRQALAETGEALAEVDRKALLLVSLCVGGMVIARTTDDPALQQRLRSTARREAIALLSAAARPGRSGRLRG